MKARSIVKTSHHGSPFSNLLNSQSQNPNICSHHFKEAKLKKSKQYLFVYISKYHRPLRSNFCGIIIYNRHSENFTTIRLFNMYIRVCYISLSRHFCLWKHKKAWFCKFVNKIYNYKTFLYVLEFVIHCFRSIFCPWKHKKSWFCKFINKYFLLFYKNKLSIPQQYKNWLKYLSQTVTFSVNFLQF